MDQPNHHMILFITEPENSVEGYIISQSKSLIGKEENPTFYFERG